MRVLLLILILCFPALAALAQQLPAATTPPLMRNCGTTGNPFLAEQHPEINERLQEITKARQENRQHLRIQQERIVIPVVFHVVYNTAEQNISTEQILSQLDILNKDFRRQNPDTTNTPDHFKPFAADAGIAFCLASLDPQGNPTTGITRTRTSKTSFSRPAEDIMFTSTGGTDAWNRNQYLNIWIAPRITGSSFGEVLGYANPPGTQAAIDGVVLNYIVVGAPPYNTYSSAFNLGRTATHEVGHWLGLQHIWGPGSAFSTNCSDSDGIADTPNQGTATNGCPTPEQTGATSCPTCIVVSCNNGPYGNMWQNFMDYTDDACMNLFTQGQAAYMQAVLLSVRASILTSPACTRNILADFELVNPQDTLIAAGTTVSFADKSVGTRPTEWLWEFDGGTPATSTEQNPSVTYNRPGRFSVRLTASRGTLSDTEVKENFIHVTVNDITVYPNPAKDVLLIEQQARTEVSQVQVVNHIGQVVLQREANERVVELRIGHLAAGVYFLRIQSTNGMVVKKVVVVR